MNLTKRLTTLALSVTLLASLAISSNNGAKSVLCRIEYPMVASSIIDGAADAFNIILIS